MFEDLIKEMERINGQSVSVPIESDENGYIDKQCPSEECQFIFKVNEEDWENIFKNEAVWCPLCRHEAPADQWFTIEQVEHAKAEALAIVKGKISNAIRSDAQKFNQRQPRNSFISMSMKVNGGISRTFAIPAKAAELMQLEIQCEECNSRFAVIGSAYFCPACGHNSVTQTFVDSLRKIKAKKDSIEIVKNALTESMGKDEAELTCRSLLETCISDGVVAFQKYCEGMYVRFGTAPFNAFQRLEQGSNIWFEVLQKGYSDWLTNDELAELKILFQKRHILAHNEGIVDNQYITKSEDVSYKEGQRIVVSERNIDALISSLEKLGSGIRTVCNNV
jgi:RNA polymerase subunit RPABC4/transcription elongation factor Spt4